MRLLGTLILAPFTWVCDRIHLFLLAISAQDSRRAEYLADRLAVRAGGLDAAQELLQTLLAGSAVRIMVRRSALASAEPSEWLAAADLGRAEVRAGMREREQRSIRLEAALLRSHPATGLRSRLVDKHAPTTGCVVVGADEWAASDAELAGDYARAQRALQRSPAF